MRRSSVAAALAALALWGCATSPPAPKLPPLELDGWHEAQVGDVTLLAPLPEADLQRYADAVAILLAVATRITNVAPEPSRLPVRVVLAPPAVYEGLSTPEYSGGVAATRLTGHFLAVSLADQRVYVRQVLLHEVTHFLSAKSGEIPYPFWYSEGFATLLSSVRQRDDIVFVGSPPWGMLDRLRRIPRIQLVELLAYRRGDVIREMALAYASSWATVHYLSSQPDTEPLVKLVELQASGADSDGAVQQALGISVDELSRRVEAHVQQLLSGAPGGLAVFEARGLSFAPERPVRAVPRAEVAWLLGEHAAALEMEAGDVPQSCAFYARALAEQPTDARSRAASARCAARAGDSESARAEAARAVAEAPDDARVQVFAGEVWQTRGDLAAAREAFTRATELAPGDPRGWAALGATYAGEGEDPAPGIAALERARALGGWEPAATLLLAKLHLRAGQRDAARQRLTDVARLDRGGDAGAEAEKLLAER